MKKSILSLVLVLLLFLISSCGNLTVGDDAPSTTLPDDQPLAPVDISGENSGGTAEETVEEAAGAFVFEIGGVSVPLGVPPSPVINTLGEPFSSFENPSCAFEGVETVYFYSGFELYTEQPENEAEFISMVVLVDDSVSTDNGVYLGMRQGDVIDAYGDGFVLDSEQMVYTRGPSTLTFVIEDGVVASIMYAFLYG